MKRRRSSRQSALRVSRVVSDLDGAEAFSPDGLRFHAITRERSDMATLAGLGWGDADSDEVVMRLGAQDVALVRFAKQGSSI